MYAHIESYYLYNSNTYAIDQIDPKQARASWIIKNKNKQQYVNMS